MNIVIPQSNAEFSIEPPARKLLPEPAYPFITHRYVVEYVREEQHVTSWIIRCGDRSSGPMCWDEMIGLMAKLTCHKGEGPTMDHPWLLTESEHFVRDHAWKEMHWQKEYQHGFYGLKWWEELPF